MHFDLPSTAILAVCGYVVKCFIDALPNPLPSDPRFYTFLFRFLHALVANFRLASLPPVVDAIPATPFSMALAEMRKIDAQKEVEKEMQKE